MNQNTVVIILGTIGSIFAKITDNQSSIIIVKTQHFRLKNERFVSSLYISITDNIQRKPYYIIKCVQAFQLQSCSIYKYI